MQSEELLKKLERRLNFVENKNSISESLEGPRLEKKLFRLIGSAISDFQMISEGDRILVAISGGKDSWLLLYVLQELKKRAPIRFEIVAVNIDQGFSGFRQDTIEEYVRKWGLEYHMEYFDIAGLLEEKAANSTPCSLCSRLRRGSLYGLAEKLSCNKIALGHHLDDIIETFLLNSFYSGKLATMAPKLQPEKENCQVIRPMIYVEEKDIIQFVKEKAFPIVCCQCPLMCGEDIHGDFKRKMMKDILLILQTKIPNIKNSILASLKNVNLTHLLDTKK